MAFASGRRAGKDAPGLGLITLVCPFGELRDKSLLDPEQRSRRADYIIEQGAHARRRLSQGVGKSMNATVEQLLETFESLPAAENIERAIGRES